MPLDVVATAPHYVDHALPIWLALPEAERRHFYVSPGSARDDIPGVRSIAELGRDRAVPTLAVAHGDFKAARAARRRKLALGQHGAGQSYGGDGGDHPSYPGGRDQAEASLFLVPNRHAAARTIAAYPRARVELVGCPKLDELPRRRRDPGDPPVVAFSFHFPTHVAPETATAFRIYRGNISQLSKSLKVLGHAHPRMLRQLRRWYQAVRIELVPSLVDVFERADLYVCDNSSSIFEFAATGRPVVLLNHPHYRRDVEHGLRFWEAAGVGIQVNRGRELAPAIEAALEDGPVLQAAREAALDLVYEPRRGGAQLAAAALLDWMAA